MRKSKITMFSGERHICLNIAQNGRHSYVQPDHLLISLLNTPEAPSIRALRFKHSSAFSDDKIQQIIEEVRHHLDQTEARSDKAPIESLAFKRVYERAIRLSEEFQQATANPVMLLLALFYEQECFATKLLRQIGVRHYDIQSYIKKTQGSAPRKAPQAASEQQAGVDIMSMLQPDQTTGPNVGDFLENLNEKYQMGKLSPLVGREKEIQETARILAQSRKSNPLLVGEPGVGKTTIAVGLAQLIEENKVPPQLGSSTIYSLNITALLAGTQYRGEFEKRLNVVIEFIKNEPNAILFIDEIHLIIGTGSTSGSNMDIANQLKPLLASGEISCIGATTYKEYRSIFEKEEALARRFQKVDVPEPSAEETVAIIRGLKARLEKHHHLTIPDDVIELAVSLSKQYIKDRRMPDLAIDIIDEAGADVNMTVEAEKILTADIIHKIVARKANLPTEKIQARGTELTKQIGSKLKQVIFGQDHAIDSLLSTIHLAEAGLRDAEKPIGSFLFAGPTGVGKTEVTKKLAEFMHVNLVRLDMSEYMEPHSVSKLIGAPPGYVGHDQAGILSESVSKEPHSIVLLDEIEKAHKDIYNILLQVMDYGVLTDSQGRKIDFRHVILIMTTNAGASVTTSRPIGFADSDQSTHNDVELARVFSPEFRNRFDEIIQFNALPKVVVGDIIRNLVEDLQKTLQDKKVKIVLTDEAVEWFVEQGYDAAMGARPLARMVTNRVKKPLAKEMLYGQLNEGGKVTLRTSEDGSLLLEYS